MLKAMEVLGQGMAAQRIRMQTASANLANAETTRTAAGGAYRRQEVVFQSTPVGRSGEPGEDTSDFESTLQGVKVAKIQEDQSPLPMVYDPGHPDANADGMVAKPNVNVVDEMVDIMGAARSFESNVTAFEALKQMVNKSMEIGR